MTYLSARAANNVESIPPENNIATLASEILVSPVLHVTSTRSVCSWSSHEAVARGCLSVWHPSNLRESKT